MSIALSYLPDAIQSHQKADLNRIRVTSRCINVDVSADSYQSLSCSNWTITPEEIERGVKFFSAAIFASE